MVRNVTYTSTQHPKAVLRTTATARTWEGFEKKWCKKNINSGRKLVCDVKEYVQIEGRGKKVCVSEYRVALKYGEQVTHVFVLNPLVVFYSLAG